MPDDREARLQSVLAHLSEGTDADLKPGRYAAYGGYVYVVNPDASITIESGPTGAGRTLTGGKAFDAIRAQLGSGDFEPQGAKRSMGAAVDDAVEKAHSKSYLGSGAEASEDKKQEEKDYRDSGDKASAEARGEEQLAAVPGSGAQRRYGGLEDAIPNPDLQLPAADADRKSYVPPSAGEYVPYPRYNADLDKNELYYPPVKTKKPSNA